jgi:CRISPR/Cas system CSM-associated protein Csm3 (group 7 of RAMP superfamily)
MTMKDISAIDDNQSIRRQRYIIRRILVRGTLILDTSACLGNGDADGPTDLMLLRDSISSHALLTGSSIAGALRNYLRERQKGYGKNDHRHDLTALLFGDLFSYEDEQNKTENEKIELREQDTQSPLIIDDAISTKPIEAELRDGVKIDSITRTAEHKKKYDLELLQADTEFPLSFELLIDKNNHEQQLIDALAITLQGLESKNDSQSGEISLGMKKRRGFGRCHVKEWQVWNFDLTKPDQRREWLEFDHWTPGFLATAHQQGQNIAHLLGVTLDPREDKRDHFTINAIFTLASPLLIRSGQAETGLAPDVVHLKSHRPKKESEIGPDQSQQNLVPILSGTSLAGVLRHRAERIVKTLQYSFEQKPENNKEPEIVTSIFGHVENRQAQASRLIVHEAEIKEYQELVQTRIAIDRFTGGAYHGALFQEQPVFPKKETELTLKLELQNPLDHEIGLLLLLLKDLWTEDLPVGGTSSIGRGRLKGKEAKIIWKNSTWVIKQDGDYSLNITPENARNILEGYVAELVKYTEKNNGKQSNCSNS